MEKIEKEYKLIPAIDNITISDDTRKILSCLAAMGDIYNIATEYIDKNYSVDVDKIIEGFSDAFTAYNHKIEALLAYIITQTLYATDYKSM